MAVTAAWNRSSLPGGFSFDGLWLALLAIVGFERGAVRCDPLPGEVACSCSSHQKLERFASGGRDPSFIEGWIAFPTAIADGTATGTVFLETTPPAGARSRVIANLSLNDAGVQNWIHFRLPCGEELDVDGACGVRATIVATDAFTGEKRLFGTTRAASLQSFRPEGGIILELEDWG